MTMMSAQKPSLWRVLSDAFRIISSNPLHFLALSSLFIFPVSLFNIIHTLTVQPTQIQSHFGRLLFTIRVSMQQHNSEIHTADKSQYLYGLLFHLINLCSVASITHSIFNGFHNKPLKLSSSLKSILSSFFPLLAIKIAYAVIVGAILLGFGLFMGFVFFGLAMKGYEVDGSSSKYSMIVVSVMNMVILIYFGVKWIFMDTIVVVEYSKYGLVKWKRVVALLMMFLFSALNTIFPAGYSTFAAKATGGNGNSNSNVASLRGLLVLLIVVYGGVSTILSLFNLTANTVLMALLTVVFYYFGVKWFFKDAIVVVESKYSTFAVPLERSSSLVEGKRVVALLIMLLFQVLHMILWEGCKTLAAKAAGRSISSRGLLVLVYGGVSNILVLFDLAANTVFFVHCKAFDDAELESASWSLINVAQCSPYLGIGGRP